MKIAMLGHKRIPSRESGIEVAVEELAARMVAQGHSVTCFNRRGKHIAGTGFNDTDKALGEYRGIRIRWAPTLDRRGLAAVTSAVTASFLTLSGGFDIVHYHAEGPSMMCWLPKLFGKKVIVTIHGLDHRRAKWGRIARTAIMTGEKNAVRFADEVIVLCEDDERYFLETYGRKTRLIRNGVTSIPRREAAAITKRFGLEKDSYLLFLGRLVPEKGLKCLIDAYKKLNPEKKLVIAGSGSDSDGFVSELKKQAGGDERIIFTGFVQGTLLEELFSNAYLYVLPSYLEGMPISLLEAMSCGCCCVTSDIPECTGITGDAGYSFKTGDSRDLALLLAKLCSHSELVEACRPLAVQKSKLYSWDEAASETIALYESVLADTGRNRRPAAGKRA